MQQQTVLLGLSGGVDSAVAALLLKKKGYRVLGAFMKNFSDTKNKLTGECSWIEERKMAQKIAAILDIEFITLDFEEEYKKYVIDPMFNDYKRGLTPNPDITCNTIVKFPLLWKEAKKRGIHFIATGHHARIKKTKKNYELFQGKDPTKDQSYFLYELSQYDLEHTLLPIGEYTKEEVRKIAQKNKLPNYNRPSTKGICFIGNIPLKTFLEQRIKPKIGKVINEKGEIIGTHKGAHYYTLGERVGESKGVIINKGNLSQHRFFIAEKNMRANTIKVVKEGSALLHKNSFNLKKMHWINAKDNKKVLSAHVRIRHLGKLIKAKLVLRNNQWSFKLSKSVTGVAPGQSAVFYKKDRVIGGGEISS